MPDATTDDATIFAWALTRLDGVGRVTARRLAGRFDSPADLRETPREQVFLRIKGLPSAEALTQRLFETDALDDTWAAAKRDAAAHAERGVRLLSERSPGWPSRLDALDASARPLLLWCYGDPQVLAGPAAALLARPPLEPAPFEHAQSLSTTLAGHGAALVLAAQSGFDVALAKRAAGSDTPVVLVAGCGLARLPRPLRPVASQVARSGGLLLSPFPMAHGPFDHDDHERARLQAALASVSVFVGCPAEDTPEARALAWANEAKRSAFVLGDDVPNGVRAVRGEEDFDTVVQGLQEAA